ncbi:MAG: undecaprenyl-diphosphatase UppP [Candidatus Taylorbacteria bacterium RIFCSPHIGHO2_01_FULL_46_22b]|uniref:Undecaprenyl-diphosphatase n=1 Tax=Candidatus Taylorbacteria bacterium RIFCSPHIGHO2_01_FULL_46_22b TaxID=1802301 RepID=A0A1G2M658_9BACT|nr:MAG: undecaprenyl-diphosphatase UppP [Candidatus Taylorbacteria bacterium RIFCSPHIGHO2_01_FULL_46_22b]
MDFLFSGILGLTEGLTEFIPVSSSGHLILIRKLFGIVAGPEDLAFDAVLQLAATFAVVLYFRKEISALIRTSVRWLVRAETDFSDRTLLKAIIIGTIPAVILGLLLEKYMETVFRSGAVVAWTLLIGALLMYIADRFGKQDKPLSTLRGGLIGFFQALALVPGISRSGATIAGGLLNGLSRVEATRFSFLLALPILLGSGVKKLFELGSAGFLTSFGSELFFGSLIAFVSGFFAIHFLIKYLSKHNLNLFIWYRVGLAILVFVCI